MNVPKNNYSKLLHLSFVFVITSLWPMQSTIDTQIASMIDRTFGQISELETDLFKTLKEGLLLSETQYPPYFLVHYINATLDDIYGTLNDKKPSVTLESSYFEAAAQFIELLLGLKKKDAIFRSCEDCISAIEYAVVRGHDRIIAILLNHIKQKKNRSHNEKWTNHVHGFTGFHISPALEYLCIHNSFCDFTQEATLQKNQRTRYLNIVRMFLNTKITESKEDLAIYLRKATYQYDSKLVGLLLQAGIECDPLCDYLLHFDAESLNIDSQKLRTHQLLFLHRQMPLIQSLQRENTSFLSYVPCELLARLKHFCYGIALKDGDV